MAPDSLQGSVDLLGGAIPRGGQSVERTGTKDSHRIGAKDEGLRVPARRAVPDDYRNLTMLRLQRMGDVRQGGLDKITTTHRTQAARPAPGPRYRQCAGGRYVRNTKLQPSSSYLLLLWSTWMEECPTADSEKRGKLYGMVDHGSNQHTCSK